MSRRVSTPVFEDQGQAALFEWARWASGHYPELRLLNASMSGVRLLPGQARKAKALGMVGGFPDVFLPVKQTGFGALFIEMKRLRVGKLSPEQRAWLRNLAVRDTRRGAAAGLQSPGWSSMVTCAPRERRRFASANR